MFASHASSTKPRGGSSLADELVARGFADVTVLDMSQPRPTQPEAGAGRRARVVRAGWVAGRT
jgi:hypothetical protein